MRANNNLCPTASAGSDRTFPIRGSRDWTKRVLELLDRDCMDDFEELCVLLGITPVPPQQVE